MLQFLVILLFSWDSHLTLVNQYTQIERCIIDDKILGVLHLTMAANVWHVWQRVDANS